MLFRSYATVKWQEFYETSPNSLDLVFVGSSYAYRSFDAEVFDNKLNVNSFNMGSPLQKPVESYYVLKETLKLQKPSFVIYDVNWGVFNEDKYFNTKLWNFDNMNFSINKINYLLNVFDTDQYFNAVFKSMRYHDEFDELILGKKPKQSSNNIETYLKQYKGKGFVINNGIVSLDNIEKPFKNSKENPKVYNWNKKQLKYFRKSVELCKKENIKLVLVTAPLAPSYLENYNEYWYDYDTIHKSACALAQQYALKYFDYNMINKSENIVTDKDFSDTNHLNYDGAQKISLDFANRLKEELR